VHVVSKLLRRITDICTLFQSFYGESRIYVRCLEVVATNHGYMHVVSKLLRRITNICTLFQSCFRVVTTDHLYMQWNTNMTRFHFYELIIIILRRNTYESWVMKPFWQSVMWGSARGIFHFLPPDEVKGSRRKIP
jgi:hypothetical protein